jgi:tetratricopeptide (TPR) repeat protein
MRTACYLLTAACLFTAAYPLEACAQPKPPVAAQVAQLFEQAQAAFAKGDKQGACDAYKAAWALQKSYDIAGNLGNVEVKLGKYRDAAEHLAFALDNFPPTGEPATQKAIEKKLADVLKEVGRVRVRVTVNDASTSGASVTVNGTPAGTSPIAGTLFVAPGTVVIEAKLPGYLDAHQELAVAKGSEQAVTLALVPLAAPRRSVVPGAVLGGVAGAAAVTGAVLLAVGASKLSTSRSLNQQIAAAHDSCVPGHLDPLCSTLQSTASLSDSLEHAGVAVLIGAGAAAVGSALYFVWPESKPRTPTAGGIRVVPTATATSGGVLLSGAF